MVATRNRWQDLSRSLPLHEGPVILVDNASDDGTPERVRRDFPHVEVIPLARNMGAVARNVGVSRAGTPLVAFADDDSWWAPGSLGRAGELFRRHPRMGLMACRTLVGGDLRLDPVCAAMARSPLGTLPHLPGPSVLGFVACGAVIRKTAYVGSGGFDRVVFFAGEEERLALDLAARGWGLSYVDSVVAHHYPSDDRDPRSRDRREVLAARNRILTALMRRPWDAVRRITGDVASQGPLGRRAVARAMARAPQALARRRMLPAEVERSCRLLEQAAR